MNTLQNPEASIQDPASPIGSDPSLHDSSTPTPSDRRHRKIAKLPKPLRDLINSMLDDGAPAREIIAALQLSIDPPLPYPISEMNISDWRKGGYQDYLRQQDWRADTRFLLESGSDIPEFAQGHQMQQTLIQLALVEIFRALKAGTVHPDSPNYIRLFNALARLNREALGLRKYADATARSSAEELKKLDANRDLVTNELAMFVNHWDRAFKMPRPDLNQILAHAAAIGAHDTDRASSPVASGVSPDVEPGVSPGGQVPGVQSSKFAEEARIGLQSSTASPQSPLDSSPSAAGREGQGEVAHPASSIEHPVSSIEHPASPTSTPPLHHSITPSPEGINPEFPEYCPECQTLLPPRTSSGERPDTHCRNLRCGSPVRPRNAPHEPCPGCGVTVPDLLPNGERPVPNCPECKNPLPPPDQVPLLADYLASLTAAAAT